MRTSDAAPGLAQLTRRIGWLLPLLASLVFAAVPADEQPVALPPFLVEELAKGPPWRYAEAMGYEILSRCDDTITRRVVAAHHRMHVLLTEILPAELQLTFTVPRALILYDEELNPAASQEVITRMLRKTREELPELEFTGPPGMRGSRIPPPARRFSFLPNLRLTDRDSMTVFMIVRREDFQADRLSLTPDYISYLVRGRLPTLPPWFVSGFLTLYGQTKYSPRELTLEPLEWISSGHTSALKKDPKTAPPVMPLADFLAGRMPPRGENQSHEPIQAWQAQAALLVRWGLDPRGSGQRDALWRFAARAAAGTMTETLFQECFGCDYATAQARLEAYLPVAVRRSVTFRPKDPIKPAAVALRNATDGEISRIKGDWERLEVPFVKAISADLAPKYLEQARKTLKRAYDRADRDPRLLAVLGLCECDAGNEAGARVYLEAAASAGPIRPRANYELARLRFAEHRANPGEGGRINVRQTAEVLKPLFAARADQPALAEVYELIAETWTHSSATPTRGHLAVLDEGVRLFPRRTMLALRAAELNMRHGYRAAAEALADIGARTAADEPSRALAASLQEQLAK